VDGQTGGDLIRLLLLANQALFRASLGRFLAAEHTLEVVAECGNSSEALGVLSASPVNVVVLDCDADTRSRNDFMLAARCNGYLGRFLVITGTDDPEDAAAAIKLGAAGIFPKSEAPDRLVEAITMLARGGVWLDQRILQTLADQSIERCISPDGRAAIGLLTDRERRVLVGILGGLTNKKIGENLGLSEATIKTCVQQLFLRAGVHRRSQLVRAALEGSLGARGELTNGEIIERLAV
jgi:two-component system, NarL family, nitrate/nitrite response regulator NarL